MYGVLSSMCFLFLFFFIFSSFFFFQAEDGIRDRDVTGVRRVLFRSLPRPFRPSLEQTISAEI